MIFKLNQIYLQLACLLLLSLSCFTPLSAQFTEDFEDEVVGSNTFMGGGVTFSTTDPLDIGTFTDGGTNGMGDDKFLEANGTGNVGTISMMTAGRVFELTSVDVWLSADAGVSTSAGTVTFRGVLAGGGTVDVDFMTMPPDANSWLTFSFAGTALDGVDLTALELLIDPSKNYLALDDFAFSAADPNAVNVTISDVTLPEGDGAITPFGFVITRSNNTTSFSLTAATANGTALGGSDYQELLPTVVNFAAGGAMTQTVTVDVRGDANVERTETFTLKLTNPTNGAILVDSEGLGTITDDDTICETFEGENTPGLRFTEAGIGFNVTNDLRVNFLSGGGSGNSDYFLDTRAGDGGSMGSVGEIMVNNVNTVFELLQLDLWPSADDGTSRAAGEVTFIGTKLDLSTVSHTFSVPASSTSGWEEGFSFTGTPFDGTYLSKVEVVLEEGLNYLAIDNFKFAEFEDNQVLINIDDVSQAEGNAGTTEFTFTVTRSNNSTAFNVRAISVRGGGTNPATPGTDYVALEPLIINFAADGELSKTLSVLVNGDVDSEAPETFIVDLSRATNGAIIGDGEGIGTILDDDTLCETFEDEGAADLTSFSEGGLSFTTSGSLETGFFENGGGAGSDYYLESNADDAPYMIGSSVGSFQLTTPETGFELLRIDIWLSNDDDINTSEADQVRLIGTLLDGSPAVSVDLTTTAAGSAWTENISFAGTALEGVALTSVEVVLQGNSNYVALDNICLGAVPVCAPVVLSPPDDLCLDAGLQTGLTGGLPLGGAYSGPGVIDDGNGMTFSFDPAIAGAGVHIITYTYSDERGCSGRDNDNIEVFALPTVTFTPSVTMVDVNAGVQTGISGGLPMGGMYAGDGVTDDGNGMTFSFDPTGLTPGTTTAVFYAITDENGCAATASSMIMINELILPANECDDAADLNSLFGQTYLEAQTSAVWDNTNYTTSSSDPTMGYECFGEPGDGTPAVPTLERTIWYSFVGDGNMYRIRAVQCTVAEGDYAPDTQMAIYSGDCGNFTPVACGEDEDFANGAFNADVNLMTEVGTTYLLMLDGFGPNFEASGTGQYCLEVTNLTTVSTVDISESALELYPNPTSGWLQLSNGVVERAEVFDIQGRLLATHRSVSQSLDLTALPGGLYLLRLHTPTGVVRAKVIRE